MLRVIIIAILLAFLCHPTFAHVQFKEGSLLVRYKSGVLTTQKSTTMHHAHIAAVTRSIAMIPGLDVVKLQPNISVEEALRILRKDKNVLYAEPNYLVKALVVPNDPSMSELWGLHNEGVAGIDMGLFSAWNITQGCRDVVVGVIDTGIDYNHPDLAANIWRDARGSHGFNAIVENDNPLDDNGHGTHVAGTIGAVGNNGLGVVGVNWQVKIIGCKFLDAYGSGYLEGAIASMDYLYQLATQEHIPIVATNNSWGGGSYSQAMADAIKAHQSAGILFIAAAGNDAANNDKEDFYPANYSLGNVIAVAALNKMGNLADFSNHGLHTVHVAAPGQDILSTFKEGEYETLSGTSMATPHVTGLIALLKSAHPEYSINALRNLVIDSGLPLPSLDGKILSGRLVQAYGEKGQGALTCQNQRTVMRLAPTTRQSVLFSDESFFLSLLAIDCDKPAFGEGMDIYAQDKVIARLAGDGNGIYQGATQHLSPGSYHISLQGNDDLDILVLNADLAYQAEKVPLDYEAFQGTSLPWLHSGAHTIELPFPIPFSSPQAAYKKLYIFSSGVMSFTDSNISSQNAWMPSQTQHVQTLVAPFWDALIALQEGDTSSRLHYGVVGEEGHRRFIVEWEDVGIDISSGSREGTERVRRPSKTPRITFQAVFYEDSPNVLFNYKNMTIGDGRYDNGARAVVGLQMASGAATQYSSHSPKIDSNSALLFSLQPIDNKNN